MTDQTKTSLTAVAEQVAKLRAHRSISHRNLGLNAYTEISDILDAIERATKPEPETKEPPKDGFTCGRRVAMGLDDTDSPFVMAGQNIDTWGDDGTCSFCGSLKPEVVLNHIDAGDVEIGATDKNYKIYVGGAGLSGKFYFHHFYNYNDGKPGQLIIEFANRFMKAWKEKRLKFQGGYEFYVKPMFLT